MPTKKKVSKKVSPKQNPIIKYIKKNREGRRQKTGVLIANIDTAGIVKLGWSKVNFKAGDVFNRETGIKIATERTKAKETVPLPQSILKDAFDFQGRCHKYFKNAKGFSTISCQLDDSSLQELEL